MQMRFGVSIYEYQTTMQVEQVDLIKVLLPAAARNRELKSRRRDAG